MRIAVAGGTGAVGEVRGCGGPQAGHEVVFISRSSGVDVNGDGLPEALQGRRGGHRYHQRRHDESSQGHRVLHRCGRTVAGDGGGPGVARLVVLSIVGLERVPGFGYYEAKLAHEEALRAGPLPVTIVRATQFHEFPAQVLSRAGVGPLALVPVMRIQPVARAVGEALVGIAAEPTVTTVEIAGPEEKDLVALARAIVRKRHTRRMVLPLPVPGRAGRAMRTGGQLPSPGARIVGPTFAEWLEGEDLAALFT